MNLFVFVDCIGKLDKFSSLISHLGLDTELDSVNTAPAGQNLRGSLGEKKLLSAAVSYQIART